MNAVRSIVQRELDDRLITAALREAQATQRSVLDVLEESAGFSATELTEALARLLEYPVFSAEQLAQLEPAFDLVPPAEARRRECVLVHGTAGALTVVIANPLDARVRNWLEVRVTQKLEWVLASRVDIAAYLSRREQNLRAIDTALVDAQSDPGADSDLANLSRASLSQEASPIVKLVHSTVYDALCAGASDIHLETLSSGLAVRYRIDGVLESVATVSGVDLAEQVISRIKVMSELDIAERRVPQDGRFKIASEGRSIDFRVSIIPSVYGEDAVLRVLDKQALTDKIHGLRLDGLGFDPQLVLQLRRLSLLPYGLLLVTGPTGSGKTTTLYAAISETQTGKDKIVTIEDPVEYQLPGVLQIPVNEKKGLTFARGLRSILRHDPDKIMVGEIRDPETAQIAVQSALTGHLVFTTVHANNVFDVISRFVHMEIDTHSLVAALSGVLAQRLVRVVCEQCAVPYVPTRRALEESGLQANLTAGYRFHVGTGCLHCRGSGYRGRKAIGELLVLNDEIREAIIARAPVRQLKELARAAGSRFIRGAALELACQGATTLEEVNRVTTLAQ
jgi:general secretion pathway protein E